MRERVGMPCERKPAILVFSSLFPSTARPQAGLFIRERMFRVGKRLPVTVVSPQPWFPFQCVIRYWRPHFRSSTPFQENQQGVEVRFPRFLCIPGIAKRWDGWLMALCCYPLLKKLKREGAFDVIDAHFAYPDGFAAVKLGQWLGVPVTITLRGTEVPLSRYPGRRQRILEALASADWVFSVSDSLKRHVVDLGAEEDKITVVGNGVDTTLFHPVDQIEARRRLNIPVDAKVLVTVGALVPRKGQHRVIEILPQLVDRFPSLYYVLVGGASPEGDYSTQLRQQVTELGLEDHVRFLGPMSPAELKIPLSASDVFVLATANEGWANVFLEAMACGLPVVTTDVGGNREVVCKKELGIVVNPDDPGILQEAIDLALKTSWSREAILQYAKQNEWESRIDILEKHFKSVAGNL